MAALGQETVKETDCSDCLRLITSHVPDWVQAPWHTRAPLSGRQGDVPWVVSPSQKQMQGGLRVWLPRSPHARMPPLGAHDRPSWRGHLPGCPWSQSTKGLLMALPVGSPVTAPPAHCPSLRPPFRGSCLPVCFQPGQKARSCHH